LAVFRWRRMLRGRPELHAQELTDLAVDASRGGEDDSVGWPQRAARGLHGVG
jgi:hypothetical protein